MKIEYPSPERIPLLRALWKEAFGDEDLFLDKFFTIGFSPERCRCMFSDGQPAAALYWFDCLFRGKPVAYLYAVATGKAFRNRGLCRELMADTHRLLERKGYAGTVLVPGNEGLRKLYEKMGYVPCGGIAQRKIPAADVPGTVRSLDAAGYGALRRQYLPRDGVVQEGAGLAFLASCWELYQGENCLLACTREGDQLLGAEFLGDLAQAPGLLAALGCREGELRVPGSDRPFAMYRPLSSPEIPGYFGLAYD